MKKYISPEMEMIKYDVDDTLLTSVEDDDNGINKDVNDVNPDDLIDDEE
ncbi:MAG: hypothetical protein J1E41_00265 [Ruminococcus sp.]|nr:hypothetical protein [Ruminococcus sp.]